MKIESYKVFNRYFKEYDDWFIENKYVYLTELNCLKKAIDFKFKDSIEIGGGTGKFSKPLGIKLIVEPSKKMREIAKKRGIKTVDGFAEKLQFENNKFDLVLSAFTICFVKNHIRALKEAHWVLKKNGKIVIGIIDRDSKLGKLYIKKKRYNKFYRSAKFYSSKKLINILRKIGFKKITAYQTLFDIEKIKKEKKIDKIIKGFGKGGFVVIKGVK